MNRTLLVGSVLCMSLVAMASGAAEVMTFDSPALAAKALAEACKNHDFGALAKVFGERNLKELTSGDEVADKDLAERFSRRCDELLRLKEESADKAVLIVGADSWPFPVPIVRENGKWRFDSDEGIKELAARRIGRNELGTIAVCRTYAEAQRAYAEADHDGDDVLEYAQFIVSNPGEKDGLYWEEKEGEPKSPLGPLFAKATKEGYKAKTAGGNQETLQPFHGYLFRILLEQGDRAPGGSFKYLINGNMIAGFGLVAYPAEYGRSGIMTFTVGPNGTVYQRDFGEKTAKHAEELKKFDPDEDWERVEEAE